MKEKWKNVSGMYEILDIQMVYISNKKYEGRNKL